MTVRFTEPALRQIDAILEYLQDKSPRGATNVSRRLRAVLFAAAEHPLMGQRSDLRGYRRLVVKPYPYVILYRVDEDGIVVHAIRHAARRREW